MKKLRKLTLKGCSTARILLSRAIYITLFQLVNKYVIIVYKISRKTYNHRVSIVPIAKIDDLGGKK